MLGRLKDAFLSAVERKDGGGGVAQQNERELAIAMTALMIEAARADEVQTDIETDLIRRALTDGFDLSTTDAERLFAEAARRQADAVDLHQFTKLAKGLPHDEKIAFVEGLWRIVLSNDDRDPYEEAVIRRICSLIYVSDIDSGAARQRVAAG